MLNVYVLVQDGLSWLESAEQINWVLSYYYHIFTTKAENKANRSFIQDWQRGSCYVTN